MKIYKYLFLPVAATLCLACNKEIKVSTQNSSVKTLTIEAYNAEMDTKNAVDASGNVLWNPHDSISVFFGDYSIPFYAYNTKPVTRANFIGTVLITTGTNAEYDESSEDYIYWGVYPYQTHHFKYVPSKYEGGVACFVDELQTATEGTFDRSTFVTVARSNDYSRLAFYNLCGGVRFKLSSSDIEMVTFTGNNNEALAGEVVVDMDTDGHPYAREHYSEIKTIRLSAPEGTTFKPGVWYYLVSLPAELSNGFTMKFISKSQSKMAVLKTGSPVNIERSHFGSLGCPDANLEFSQYDQSEEEVQLKPKMFIKSVEDNGNGTFAVEIGYSTIRVKTLFESIDFKAEGYSDKSLINDPYSQQRLKSLEIGPVTASLSRVYLFQSYNQPAYEHIYYYDYETYNYMARIAGTTAFPSDFFYSSKSRKFISVDNSDICKFFAAHNASYTNYVGTSGNNSFYNLNPFSGSGIGQIQGNKIYNIVDDDDNLFIEEWADYSSITETGYYGNARYIWLIDGLCPAVFCLQNQKYNFAVFPEKGVMRSIVLPENYSVSSDSFCQVGEKWFLICEDREKNKCVVFCLRVEDGYPSIGSVVELGGGDFYRWKAIPIPGSESVMLYDSHYTGCTSYIKLCPDGSIKEINACPGVDSNDNLLRSSFSQEKDYIINLVEEISYFGDLTNLRLYKHRLDTSTTTDLYIPLIWSSGALLDNCSKVYEDNMIYVTYEYIVDGKYMGQETIIIDCDSMKYTKEDGYVRPSGDTK